MLDARLVTPRPRDVDGWNLPTRTEGRGKEAARGLLKVHALAREQVSSLGVHISRRGSHLHGRIPDHRLTLLAPQGRRARAHLTFVFRPRDAPGGGTISHASSMALRAYECGSCLHAVPCWEDLARIGCRSPRRSTAPSPKARRGSRNSGSIPGFPTFIKIFPDSDY